MDDSLLAPSELPPEFTYPPEFLRVVEQGLLELEPWWVLTGDMLRGTHAGLAKRYPARRLIPIAKRQDNDDVACWDLATGQVSIVHDFASPGWGARSPGFQDFRAWFHSAVDDMLDHW
ncbi:hypothetical protein [Arthrobacter sp. 35W]|uniref:hypothetical protein n=1 Tax=Arthrobacter sp. 35W TaxID=1132441 RepID=UPI0003FBB70A|nr:hypothetical protein [Arthrobacter sp. 35W]